MSDWSKLRDWIHRTLGRRSKTDFLIMLLVGVLVMVIAIPTGEKKDSPPAGEMQQEEVQDESGLTQWKEDYRSGLEEQLKELLQAMDGVGRRGAVCGKTADAEGRGRGGRRAGRGKRKSNHGYF